MERAIRFGRRGAAPLSSGRQPTLAPRPRSTRESELLKNSINTDKFTGFSGKFLKVYRFDI